MIKILKFMKPYRGVMIAALVLSLINNAMQLVLPTLMADIINNGITDGNLNYIFNRGLIMLALSAAAIVSAILSGYFSSKTATYFGFAVRRKIFTKVEGLHQCDVDKIGTSSLITRSTNDIRQIQDMLIMMLQTVISAPIVLVGGAFMAFLLNPRLSSTIVITIPVIALIAFLISKKVLPLFDKMQKKTDKLNQILREKLSGIRVIRAFNRSDYEDKRFQDANFDLTGLALKTSRIFAMLIPIAVLLLFGMVILVVWMGSRQIVTLDAATHATQIANTVGNLQALIVYLLMIVFSVSMAAALFVMFPRAEISAKRINEVLELETEIVEPSSPKLPQGDVMGRVEFRSVSFQYPGAQEAVLDNISFEVNKGETLAIIGGTGCGKSTLVNLIPRFYDVSSGRILVNGIDIREMTTQLLHSKIGFIPQKAILFSGTVADNLRFGKPEATEDEMWRTLKIAQADDFVKKLPLKLYDMISQDGRNLSGGQKQRLSIARALIKETEIYVFDDSFSALDYTTDSKLRKSIKANLGEATLIIVAQRVGTIIDADKIIVLDEGKIVGFGKHSELIESCPVYREIAYSQLSKEDLA